MARALGQCRARFRLPAREATSWWTVRSARSAAAINIAHTGPAAGPDSDITISDRGSIRGRVSDHERRGQSHDRLSRGCNSMSAAVTLDLRAGNNLTWSGGQSDETASESPGDVELFAGNLLSITTMRISAARPMARSWASTLRWTAGRVAVGGNLLSSTPTPPTCRTAATSTCSPAGTSQSAVCSKPTPSRSPASMLA